MPAKVGWDCVDGIVFDLGISSMQVDSAERGFLHQAGPLDMRFDDHATFRASDLLND